MRFNKVYAKKRMDQLHYGQNFEKRLNGKIHYHSIEEHPKISKIAPFSRCWYQFSVRNTKIYKICNLQTLTFSTFYNVSHFAILLILECSSMLW